MNCVRISSLLEKSIRLGELIHEFFDITRYNLQDIELEAVEINLTLMLEQLADELYGVLQEKRLPDHSSFSPPLQPQAPAVSGSL